MAKGRFLNGIFAGIFGLAVLSTTAQADSLRKKSDLWKAPASYLVTPVSTPASAVEDFSYADYDGGLFWEHLKSVPLETAGVYAGIIGSGFGFMNWGTSGFYFHADGWFGLDNKSGGIDKLGHAFTGATIADLLTDRIRQTSARPEGAALTASILSFGVMTVMEIGDGFSKDYGFSYQDLIANAVGVGFSFLRNTIPGMREKVDFRMEYWKPDYDKGFHPLLGYESMKFVVALKFSGFEVFEETPMRFFELHAGYHARGFSDRAKRLGVRTTRTPYFGVGLNLTELLFQKRQSDEHWGKTWARFAGEHIQLPYTYIATDIFR